MILAIRKSRIVKPIAVFMALESFYAILRPAELLALTNGPSQPEMAGPSAVTFDSYVDPFTGDFQYGIPLFEMGDIPLTLNYSAGASSEQEASWTGLGWSLNPGSISREVRGLPDDFNGDIVQSKSNMRDQVSCGLDLGLDAELFDIGLSGEDSEEDEMLDFGAGLGVSLDYNNYTGYSISTRLGVNVSLAKTLTVGADFTGSTSSFGGLGLVTKLDLTKAINIHGFTPGTLTINASSREGVQKMTLATANTEIDKLSYLMPTGSLSFKYGQRTYTPKIEHSLVTDAFSISTSVGGVPIFSLVATANANGYYSRQYLPSWEKETESLAYGYFYADNENTGNVLNDFNREKENNIDELTPNIPIPYTTPDVYAVTSPAVSGSFRAFRNDIGYIVEPSVNNVSNSDALGLGFEVGAGLSPEATLTASTGQSVSRTWMYNNNAAEYLPMASKGEKNHIGEGVFFAMTNEMSPESDQDYVADFLKGDNPFEFELADIENDAMINGRTLIPDFPAEPIPGPYARIDSRQLRTSNISYLTNEELDDLESKGVITSSYRRHKVYGPEPSDEPVAHHIAEFTITSGDGTKSVFGLPAYNITKKEVTFSIGHSDPDAEIPYVDPVTGYVKYDPVVGDNSISNTKGSDHLYSATITPAYAHSYMLTAVLSNDYVDVSGNGPTDDDMGHFVKYNYGEYNETSGLYEPDIPNFKWRTPVTEDGMENYASLQEGLKNNFSDDKANYVYGEKEIWYLHSIETKDYYMEFVLAPRYDALGVLDENGGVDDTHLQMRLEKINLYAKADIIRYNFSSTYGGGAVINFDELRLPTPLKTVHFVYSYALCQGVPNKVTDPEITGTGKLTLEGLYFTYQNSFKNEATGYTFIYANNPDYTPLAFDRWGSYRENTGVGNVDYPYVYQDDIATADLNASAWNLSEIHGPGGGVLNIYYEADRYGYVQDREATYMYNVVGASYELGDPFAHKLYDFNETTNEYENYNYLYFELPRELDGGMAQVEADDYIQTNCIIGHELEKKDPTAIGMNIYFRFYTNTYEPDEADTELDEAQQPEYVCGYGAIDFAAENWAGAVKDGAGNYKWGYIKLKDAYAKINDTEPVNPVSKAGWQFAMLNARYNVMQTPYIWNSFTFEDFLSSLSTSLVESVFGFTREPSKIMRNDQNLAKFFDPEKSSVRLGALDGYKIGGGYRVSKITMNDAWSDMTDAVESSSTYGKEYFYTDENGKCTGVAAYEPMIGNDENPCRRPISYSHQDGDMNYQKYIETPLGESFYPSPVVGYAMVTTKDLMPTFGDGYEISSQGTGKTINRFYTARDFPVRYSCTKLYPKIVDPEGFDVSTLITDMLFGNNTLNLYTGSQGYVVETNDMHGKPFTVEVYPEAQDPDIEVLPISKTTYIYKENADGTLNNTVRTANKVGQIKDQQIGVSYDVTVDFRENVTENTTETYNLDVEAGPFPFFVGVAFPPTNYSYMATRLAVVNKVINRNGVIEKVINQTEGSVVTAENVLFDSKTGQALLTTTQNEFDDGYYIFNLPAHWVYGGMGLSSENYRYNFDGNVASLLLDEETGRLNKDGDRLKYLQAGDKIKLLLTYADNTKLGLYATLFRTVDCDGPGSECYFFINEDGQPVEYEDVTHGAVTSFSGEVLWSGHKNQLGDQAMNVLMRLEPISGDMLDIDVDKVIIDASAATFSDRWQMPRTRETAYVVNDYCLPLPDATGTADVVNPYEYGLLGIWRPITAYKYLTDRDYTYTKDASSTGFGGAYTNIRQDGSYNTFEPYWMFDATSLSWKPISEMTGFETEAEKWQFTVTATKVNPFLGEVETRDALGRYNASIPGYNNSVVTMSAQNAAYSQIGFEDFEDFYQLQAYQKTCDDKHFDLTTNGTSAIGYKFAHTGNYAAEMDGGDNLKYTTTLTNWADPREVNDYVGVPFEVANEDMLPTFNPLTFSLTGVDYIMDFWVKKPASSSATEPVSVEIKYNGSVVTSTTEGTDENIDDWHRYRTSFNMPISAAGNSFEITINNASTYTTSGVGYGEACPTCMYVDDVRILPQAAVATSYVYDYRTKRLMSVLDDNHYATFYEYDEDGKLIRIKKETERGIMTIQESRNYVVKQ